MEERPKNPSPMGQIPIQDSGRTLINLNILNAEKILEANENPEKYPDLIVRVTGFSAYFASLSPQFRQLVVDRVVRTL